MTITYDQVLAELRTVVAERPDYVYECPAEDRHERGPCKYVHRSQNAPGCLIGTWLHRFHGVSLDRLAEAENLRAHQVARECLNLSSTDVGCIFGLVDSVQASQDVGDPWGKITALQ